MVDLRAGLGGAWIGLTVQHCGNHGAMSTRAWVNKAMGLCDDLIGGSSLMWRYHHQVCLAETRTPAVVRQTAASQLAAQSRDCQQYAKVTGASRGSGIGSEHHSLASSRS